MRRNLWRTTIVGLLTLILTLTLVVYAEDGFHAAAQGLDLFLRVVFPSLFPFFVLSEIMLGMGVVHFLGVIFEPLMRPVFNVPGVGSFVLSMGLAAGYPMDAVITSKFRIGKMCTRIEGERLLAFTNTADPLFIFGAVAVGMFGMPRLGYTMAAAHYLAALCVGLCFRFHGRNDPEASHRSHAESTRASQGFILTRAAEALVKARREDGRSFGKMLGDAVNDSIKTLLMICGFIMLFSVTIKILTAVGFVGAVAAALTPLFGLFGISSSLISPMIAGIVEIDVGALAVSVTDAPLAQKAAMAGAIIAWSGLSVHGQVMSVMSGTDLRFKPYIIARILHATFAAGLTLLFMGPGAPVVDVFAHSPSFGHLAVAPLGTLASAFARAISMGLHMLALSFGALAAAGIVMVAIGAVKRLRARVI